MNIGTHALALRRTTAFLGLLAVSIGAVFAGESIPASMQVAHRTDVPGALAIGTAPVPKPAEGQVLVRVYAVGLNPVDWELVQPPNRPDIPGRDVAGVVVAVGPKVSALKVGDKVHGDLFRTQGGLAEYVLASAFELTLKPKNFTFEQSAAIGLSGRTGLQMALLANLQKDERVLVIGAAGGVGGTVVQVAHQLGAHVVADASSRHNEYLKSIGADEIINYDKVDVVTAAKDFPVVINATATEDGNALKYVAAGGLVIEAHGGIIDREWSQKDELVCLVAGVTCIRMGLSAQSRPGGGGGAGPPGAGPGGPGGPGGAGGPGPQNGGSPSSMDSANIQLLQQLTKMAEDGKYVMPIEKVFPLAQANDAMGFARSGNREGKIIIAIRADANTL